MANPDRTIDPRILNAAREEFLESGFMKASLRKICADAGVTTGAFYKRYKNKDELFDALVSPTVSEFKNILQSIEPEEIKDIEASGSIEAVWSNPTDNIQWLMNYMYDHYAVFRLIFCSAEGSTYEDFLHEITELACGGTMKVMGLAYEKGLVRYKPEEDELHVVLTAYCSAIVEPVKHAFSREKALEYCESLNRLFAWREFFGC